MQNSNEITKKIINMVDKIVTKDIKTIDGINEETIYLAFQILNFFAFKNPGPISKGSISNQFDTNISFVSKILNILEKIQLIHHIDSFTSQLNILQNHVNFSLQHQV